MKKSPEEIYGQLYLDVQSQKIFSDGKAFSDAIALKNPKTILAEYFKAKAEHDFNLKKFVEERFKLPDINNSRFVSDKNEAVSEHIAKLWEVLKREPDASQMDDRSSLIPLPYPYIVPGGRFNEIYYWDSYFTMLGLKVSGKVGIIEHMIQNFAWMIDQFGFIPNGNRSYFLGRSQPPFFTLMVQLLNSILGFEKIKKYIGTVEKEYQFWMSKDRVVQFKTGCLNRHWDHHASARGEMLGDDLELLHKSGRTSEDLFRHVRAACESGWDFSCRWFDQTNDLTSIQCAHIFPIDLNCLIYQMEKNLGNWYNQISNVDKSNLYTSLANKRKRLIIDNLWSKESGFFEDYNFIDNLLTRKLSLAAVFPLFVKIATKDQAKKVAEKLEKQFLKKGGFVTTTVQSGQQWDSPNGWAPLQWICYQGLLNYGFDDLANQAKTKWLRLNEKIFKRTGKMLEKYNVVDTNLETGGGEYPVQDGFGWTNGVYLAMLNS